MERIVSVLFVNADERMRMRRYIVLSRLYAREHNGT
jgi:hypothetical protein